jgi:hypothetical protein
MMKLGRMRRAEHIARIGKGQVCTWFWWGNLREEDRLEDLGVDGRIILRLSFRKWVRRHGLD